jgi:hypothetical protein
MQSLERIATMCRERGVRLGLFYYRLDQSGISDPQIAAMREGGFAVHDIAEWFTHLDPRDYLNSIVDPHPNVQGLAIVAKGIAAWVRREEVRRATTGRP